MSARVESELLDLKEATDELLSSLAEELESSPQAAKRARLEMTKPSGKM
jgi:hypothetical protein